MKPVELREREELLNRLTHCFGLALSVGGLLLLLASASRFADTARMAGCTVFGLALVLLYLASTVYHSSTKEGHRTLFRTLDHSAIYLLIAGTYTPFTLVFLDEGPRTTLLALVWGLAAAGITFKLFFTHRFKVASTLVYVAMGWSVLWEAEAVLRSLPGGAVGWLVAGGLAYTLGVAFYLADRLPYHHAIWHIFVLAGSVCHYVAVFVYIGAG